MVDEAIDCTIEADGIAVIRINVPEKDHNRVDLALLKALETQFTTLSQHSGLQGVIVISAKPDSFITGMDVRMLLACQSRSDTVALAQRGQALCNRIAEFPVPVVAAIEGACCGVGLEWVLACHGRVAGERPSTYLSLAHTALGLSPSWGATLRLPRQLGLWRALRFMLDGQPVGTASALAMGLIDQVVPSTVLLTAARRRVHTLRQHPEAVIKPTPLRRMIESNGITQQLILNRTRQGLRQPPQHNQPALAAMVDCVEYGLRKPPLVSLEYEAERFGELWQTRQARALVGVHLALRERDQPFNTALARPVEAIALLGAGQMGWRLAALSSRSGLRVRLKDINSQTLLAGLQAIDAQVGHALKRGDVTATAATQWRRRVTPTTDYRGLRGYPLVLETAFEDLTLKRQLLREVETHGDETTIFASNTSSLPIAAITEGAQRPQQVIGMHYASPLRQMSLLEIVVTPQTAPAVVATAVALGQRQGKRVIIVNDGAGFYLNRMLAPYLNEAAQLLLEGVAVEAIDAALVRFGFLMGPLTWLDEVGIDIAEKISAVVHEHFGERLQPSPLLPRLLELGRYGRKQHRGFYRYRQHHEWRAQRPVDSRIYKELGLGQGTVLSADDITERCVLLMLNEAVRCRDEGIIRSERDGDIAAVLGGGFPAFRGGPFYYLRQLGAETVAKHLTRLARQHGARFEPAPGLVNR